MRELGKQWTAARAVVVVVACLAAAAALAACGGSSDSSSSGGTTGESSNASQAGGGDSAAQKRLAELYEGTYALPPKTAPKPQPGKTIWLISCGQQIGACANGTRGAQEAAEALGWSTKVFDTKGDPSEMLNGVRSAVAGGADG